MSVWEINAWKLFLAGGPVMWPLAFSSIFALGIFIEKIWYFSAVNGQIQKLKQEIFKHLKAGKLKEAISLCDVNDSPLARIIKAGILKSGSSRAEMKEAMEDASYFEMPRLESRLSALATIANVAPLLGLLGTVAGITGSFHTIAARANSNNPMSQGELVGGIGEALVATLGGLLVAITAFIAYNYCLSRAKRMTLDMERIATEVVDFLSQSSEFRT